MSNMDSSGDRGRARVLVVDDDAAFAQTLVEMLDEVGSQGVAVASPQRALELVMDGSFDAAFVDLMMPEITGTDLAGKLRVVSPETAVMILTGHADLDSAIEGIHQGVFDYIRKEALGLIELRHAVRRAAQHSRLMRENRRLVEQLRESRDLLDALDRITADLAAEIDPQRLLHNLVDRAKALCRAKAGRAILLRALPKEGWIVTAGAGEGVEFIKDARFGYGEGIMVSVAEGAPSVVVAQARLHPRFCDRCDELPADLSGFACVPIRSGQTVGALTMAGSARGSFEGESHAILSRLAAHAAISVDNAFQHDRALNFFTHTCNILVTLLDGLDASYSGHSRRVAALVDMVTRAIGMDDKQRRHVHFAALMHDIGKMRLGLDILGSITVFTDEQRKLVKQHPSLGVEILRPIALWEEILPIVQSHHERWDGQGYPHGLAGEAIPLGARIVAVAEVFEAMTRRLPWLPVRPLEEALDEISQKAGLQFDAEIARTFIGEYEKHGDEIDH